MANLVELGSCLQIQWWGIPRRKGTQNVAHKTFEWMGGTKRIIISIKNWMAWCALVGRVYGWNIVAVLVREISPSKTESDLIPTDPEMEVAIELLDSQVFSGSVDRGSDRWRFLGDQSHDAFPMGRGRVRYIYRSNLTTWLHELLDFYGTMYR